MLTAGTFKKFLLSFFSIFTKYFYTSITSYQAAIDVLWKFIILIFYVYDQKRKNVS